MSNVKIDQAKATEFAAKMVDVLNGAALAIMTSVGHRTGLFDTMATMQQASSGPAVGKSPKSPGSTNGMCAIYSTGL